LAYYTKKDHTALTLTIAEIHNHLSDLLPTYMLPNKVLELKTFPVNSNGKKDLNKLPKSDSFNNHIDSLYVAPRNKLEGTVLQCLRQIVGITKVGIYDNFFEIGATSLDLVRLADKLKNEHDLKVSAIELFQYTNTIKLVEFLTSKTPLPHSRIKQLTAAKARLINMKRRKINNG